jgi:hypothetical protein
MKIKKVFALILLTALLAACAHFGDKGVVHPLKDTVLFEGMEFKVNSREYRYTPISVSGRPVAPEGVFVIVDLSLRNSYTSPVPASFQPRFTLVDGYGREHLLDKELSTSTAKGTNGLIPDLAPKTAYTFRLVFDVPEGKYRLRVFTPVIVSGPGRHFRAGTLLRPRPAMTPLLPGSGKRPESTDMINSIAKLRQY